MDVKPIILAVFDSTVLDGVMAPLCHLDPLPVTNFDPVLGGKNDCQAVSSPLTYFGIIVESVIVSMVI